MTPFVDDGDMRLYADVALGLARDPDMCGAPGVGNGPDPRATTIHPENRKGGDALYGAVHP